VVKTFWLQITGSQDHYQLNDVALAVATLQLFFLPYSFIFVSRCLIAIRMNELIPDAILSRDLAS
jgi:hypothetical protein